MRCFMPQALLNEEESRFRKHAGVHGGFRRAVCQNWLAGQKYHRWLLAAFSKRITGDYGIEADLTAEDASLLIGQAQRVSCNNENVS